MMIGARLIPLLFPMLAEGASTEGEGKGFSLLLPDALAPAEGVAEVAHDPNAILAEPAPETVQREPEGEDNPPEEEAAPEAELELEAAPFWWPELPPAPNPPPAQTAQPHAAPMAAEDTLQSSAPVAPVEPAITAQMPADTSAPAESQPQPMIEQVALESQPLQAEPEPVRPAPETPAPPKAEQPADVSAKRAPPPPQMAEVAQPDLPAQADELGQIQVMFEREGEATRITVLAERAETVDLMRRNADQLQSELSREGLADADLNFAERQQGKQHKGGSGAQAEAAIVSLPPPAPQSGLDLRL